MGKFFRFISFTAIAIVPLDIPALFTGVEAGAGVLVTAATSVELGLLAAACVDADCSTFSWMGFSLAWFESFDEI